MATNCPNKKSPEWIKLVDAIGNTNAYKVFLANNEEVPEMSVIDDIVELAYESLEQDSAEHFIKPGVEYTSVTVASSFDEKQPLLDKFFIQKNKSHYYYVLTPDEQRNVDTYMFRQGGKLSFGKTKKGFTLSDDIRGTVTYKIVKGKAYLFIDNKEFYEEDGIKLPKYVGSFKVPIDLINNDEKDTYLKKQSEGKTYIPYLEREIKKYLFKTRNVSVNKATSFYALKVGELIIDIYNRIFLKQITFDDLKKITQEEAEIIYNSVDFKNNIEAIRTAYKKILDDTNVEEVKQLILWEATKIMTGDEMHELSKLLDFLPDNFIKLIRFETTTDPTAYFSPQSNLNITDRKYTFDKVKGLSEISALRKGMAVNITLRHLLDKGIIDSSTIDKLNAEIRTGVTLYVNMLISAGLDVDAKKLVDSVRTKLFNKHRALKNVLSAEQLQAFDSEVANVTVAIDDQLNKENQGLTHLTNLIIGGSGVSNLNTVFGEIMLGEVIPNPMFPNFVPDKLSIAAHEIGHAVDRYLYTTRPELREGISNAINDLINAPEFQNYVVEGLRSRGYEEYNKKEIVADIFAYIMSRAIGHDATKGHLKSLHEFFITNEALVNNIFNKYIPLAYYEEYGITEETKSVESPIVALFREILNSIIQAINTLIGTHVFDTLDYQSTKITTNLTGTKYNIGNLIGTLERIVTDPNIFDLDEILNADTKYQREWTATNIQGITNEKQEFIDRINSHIENGYYKERSGKLVKITPSYNAETFWIEKQEGLVTMDKDGRHEHLYNFKKGLDLVVKLNQKYKGQFTFTKEQKIFPVANRGRAVDSMSDKREIYRIKVTQVEGFAREGEPIINEVTVNPYYHNTQDVNEYKTTMKEQTRSVLKSLEDKTVDEAIDILNDLDIPDEYKTLFNLLQDKLINNPSLKLVIDNESTERVGFYNPNTNTITIYAATILDGTLVTTDIHQIANTLSHELIHAFTVRALINAKTPAEKEFATTISRLYRIALKQTKYKDGAGYIGELEWIARVLTEPRYMEEVMRMELSVWQRLLLGIRKLFGIKTTVYDHALKTVLEYIGTNETFVPNFKFEGLSRDIEEDIYLNKDNLQHQEIYDNLDTFSKQFTFDPVEHIYTHIKTGQRFYSTTETMGKIGFTNTRLSLDKEIAEKQIKARERGANIGTVIHGIAEANLKKVAKDIAGSTGYEFDDKVVSQIEHILRQFKRPGVTILSEVLVADVDILLAGTIDMIVIDENNNVHLYDFKNKEKGFIDYLKPTKFGGSMLMSDKDRHAIQLSAYSDMLEKMTGLHVASLNVITLKPTVSADNIITSVELDKTHSPNGIVPIEYNYSANTIKEVLKIKKGHTSSDDFQADKVDPETRKQLDEKLKAAAKTMVENITELSAKSQIVNKTIAALINKKDVLYRTGKRHEIAAQEKVINQLMDEVDVEKQLLILVEYANKSAYRIWNEYNRYKKEGKQLPLTLLYAWRDSVSAFAALTNEEEGLDRLLTKEFGFEDGPAYRNILKRTINVIAEVKSLYVAEGMDQLVDFLAPFYNEIYAKVRLEKIKEYRRKKFKGEIPTGVTETEYVDNYINDEGATLEKQTKDLIRKELKRASKDINVLTRWIDNLLDSSDPVTAAMVKAFAYADEEARLGGIEQRDTLVSMVRQIELFYSQTGRIPRSNEEFYDFMLEKEDGKLTGHYIDRYTSAMMQEYRDTVAATKNLELPEQRKVVITKWLEENMPLNKIAFNDAYWTYIEEQNALGYITDDDFSKLEQNKLYATNKLTVGEMTEKSIITQETGDILGQWLSENTWDFRDPIDKWVNPQYRELEKILNNPKDPRGEFYRHILKIRREADHALPFGFRLDSRLPGVIKQNHERVASGKSIGSVIRNAISDELTFKVDDTTRTHEELLDESGRPKYFLPIHFTGRVTKLVTKKNAEGEEYQVREFDEDEQSFDIATIYHKYWSMANDYQAKSKILPQMELAKFLINKREVIKRNSLGEAIFRKRSKGATDPLEEKEEVTLNNTYLAQQVNDWFLSCVYGVEEKDEGKWGKIDVAKLLNFINKYTSLNLLGMNVVAGTANIILGETLQRIESFSKEYMNPNDFFYADRFYLKMMKGMIGDIGSRDTHGLGTHIVEYFGVFDDYGESDMDRRSKISQLFRTDTLYATSHLGEHYMQARFLFGLLANKRAIDSNGKDIGRMIDQYELKDNKLVLNDKVDIYKSKWQKKDVDEFKMKTRGILSRLHGEYGDLGKVAIQRYALGRMAYLFRHFIVPGFRRRWGKKEYIERLGQYVEGNYITTGKFVGAVGSKIFGKTEQNREEQFFTRLIGNLQSFKLSMVGEEWAALTDHEKANVHRTLYEVGFLILAIVLANLAASFKPGDDDDEDGMNERFWAFVMYQTYRLQNELMFFSPNLTSAMSILRSPAASMSFAENIILLSGQIFHPFDEYQSGAWKGRPKILKTLNNMIPIQKQYYRLVDIGSQITIMQRTAFGGKPDKEETQKE